MMGLRIAGLDEVGRGPIAGPVVAAAVILDRADPVLGLKDSKAVSEAVVVAWMSVSNTALPLGPSDEPKLMRSIRSIFYKPVCWR